MTYETTRRTVLLSTGATSAVALVAACGGGGDGNGSASTGSPTGRKTTGQETAGQELASTDEIPVGGGKIFPDEKVVVTQPEQGRFKAFSAICTHMGCTVASVSDGTINCPCHGSKYHVADGSVAHGPATRPLPAEQITVKGNSVRLT
ncbi:Rieske 2Fe-2S domain-containing protein [Streptomyces sp. NPDC007991]|uniref:Rieske (2Fe-2S) protein n=1 Tax=Streptomyces sp. NPDC007991 TaxID=3364803 RepID=UPI0036E0833D